MKTQIFRFMARPQVWIVLLLLLLAACENQSKQPRPLLLDAISGPVTGFGKADGKFPYQTAIRFEPSLLDGQAPLQARIRGQVVTLAVQERDTQALYKTWMGEVKDSVRSFFVIVQRGPLYGGMIGYGGHVYRIKSTDAARYNLAEIDPTAYPQELRPISSTQGEFAPNADPCPACSTSSLPYRIDLAVFYTNKAMNGASSGSTDPLLRQLSMEIEILLGMSWENFAFMKSNSLTRLRLTYAASMGASLTWENTSNLQQLLNNFASQTIVKNQRNLHAADLVSLIFEGATTDPCGLSYYYEDVSCNAFSVVRRACAANNYSLAHEIGHNLGLDHECYDSSRPGSGHGYDFVGVDGRHSRTLMGINTNYVRIPYFSDKTKAWGNVTCNLPSPNGPPYCGSCSADDVDMLHNAANGTCKHVSMFRCGSVTKSVWIKDNAMDQGLQPNTNGPFLYSPFVWLRQKIDTNLTHLYLHQPARTNAPNFLYVAVRNDSAGAKIGYVNVWAVPSSTTLNIPVWYINVSYKKDTIPAYSSKFCRVQILQQPQANCCYLVQWANAPPADGAPPVCTTASCVAASNKIAAKCWHNIYYTPRNWGQHRSGEPAPAVVADTFATYFQPLENSLLVVRLEPDAATNKTFTEVGGRVAYYFDRSSDPMDAGHPVPRDAGMPSSAQAIMRDLEIKIPERFKKGTTAPFKSISLTFDVGTATAGNYTIVIEQWVGREILGAYTYQIAVGDPQNAY